MKSLFTITLVLFFLAANVASSGDPASSIIHSGEIFSLQWAPTSQKLALQGVGGVWIYENGKLLIHLEQDLHRYTYGGGVEADEYSSSWGVGIAWSPNGEYLVFPALSDVDFVMELRIVDASVYEVATVQDFGWDNTDIGWSSGGNYLAAPFRRWSDVGPPFWYIGIWKSGEDFAMLISEMRSVAITKIAWSSKQAKLALSYDDGLVGILDVELWEGDYLNFQDYYVEYRTHPGQAVQDLQWNPTENIIASTGVDGVIKIWDVNTGEIIDELASPDKTIEAIDWNSDGTLLATAGTDGVVRIWEVRNGNLQAEYEQLFSTINALDWSPDDQLIATASRDGTVRIWEVDLVGGDQ